MKEKNQFIKIILNMHDMCMKTKKYAFISLKCMKYAFLIFNF